MRSPMIQYIEWIESSNMRFLVFTLSIFVGIGIGIISVLFI